MSAWIVVSGNVANGLHFTGPFDTEEKAKDYAAQYYATEGAIECLLQEPISEEEERPPATKPPNRQLLIEWLSWNDKNGTFRDEDALVEFGEVLTDASLKFSYDEMTENLDPCPHCTCAQFDGPYCHACHLEYVGSGWTW